MSKYDFEIDLSENSSTGIILGKIREGSVVLEFGCATGRMTRYMKEALSCQVYIVEFEQKAYDVAAQYAVDGLCDDIMNFRWVEKFADIRFDAIIFADVLEHLSDPEKVLEQAATLLKEDGMLHVSLPNITHNDILLKACEERFDYTNTGLLDNTHVHFWGERNISDLAKNSGLFLKGVQGTFCPTGYTEQFVPPKTCENVLLDNILRERQCGEVYQFVVSFTKTVTEPVYQFRNPSIYSHIYLDKGQGFNTDDIIPFLSEYSGIDSYIAHYVIQDTTDLLRIRFDPLESQGCILRKLSIRQGENCLPVQIPGAVQVDDGFLLSSMDPQVLAEVVAQGDPISVDAEIILRGERYIQLLEAAFLAINNGSESDNKNSNEEKLQNRIAQLTQQVEEVQSDLGAYITLTNRKDQYILELKENICRLEEINKKLEHLFPVRVYRFAGRVLRAVKRRVKRLLRRG